MCFCMRGVLSLLKQFVQKYNLIQLIQVPDNRPYVYVDVVCFNLMAWWGPVALLGDTHTHTCCDTVQQLILYKNLTGLSKELMRRRLLSADFRHVVKHPEALKSFLWIFRKCCWNSIAWFLTSCHIFLWASRILTEVDLYKWFISWCPDHAVMAPESESIRYTSAMLSGKKVRASVFFFLKLISKYPYINLYVICFYTLNYILIYVDLKQQMRL